MDILNAALISAEDEDSTIIRKVKAMLPSIVTLINPDENMPPPLYMFNSGKDSIYFFLDTFEIYV